MDVDGINTKVIKSVNERYNPVLFGSHNQWYFTTRNFSRSAKEIKQYPNSKKGTNPIHYKLILTNLNATYNNQDHRDSVITINCITLLFVGAVPE